MRRLLFSKRQLIRFIGVIIMSFFVGYFIDRAFSAAHDGNYLTAFLIGGGNGAFLSAMGLVMEALIFIIAPSQDRGKTWWARNIRRSTHKSDPSEKPS